MNSGSTVVASDEFVASSHARWESSLSHAHFPSAAALLSLLQIADFKSLDQCGWPKQQHKIPYQRSHRQCSVSRQIIRQSLQCVKHGSVSLRVAHCSSGTLFKCARVGIFTNILTPSPKECKSRFLRSQTISSLTKFIQNSITICVTIQVFLD